MTDFFNSIIAGTIQGVTELFPISSSGHLLLFSHLVNIDLGIANIAILHIGTFLAIVLGLWDKIKTLNTKNSIINIIISTIPAAIVGYFFMDWIDEKLSAIWIIAISLIFWGIILIIADQITKNMKFKTTDVKDVSKTQALIVGFGQILAFIPGTSRSGITTISGIISGIAPKTAIEYGFISGLLLIPGSAFLGIIKGVESDCSLFCIFISIIVSATIGIFMIDILRNNINKRILTIFGIYRIIIGSLILILL